MPTIDWSKLAAAPHDGPIEVERLPDDFFMQTFNHGRHGFEDWPEDGWRERLKMELGSEEFYDSWREMAERGEIPAEIGEISPEDIRDIVLITIINAPEVVLHFWGVGPMLDHWKCNELRRCPICRGEPISD